MVCFMSHVQVPVVRMGAGFQDGLTWFVLCVMCRCL